ncbi:MAG: RNA 2',3'-cyclic phosphodiesterase [Candidatus Helarchaeota archaeon]
MNNGVRSFICIEIQKPEILEEIVKIKQRLKMSKAKIKFVENQNIHLTLKFLGNISKKMIGVIEENILNKINQKSFDLELLDVGVFPSLNFPKVIWIGTGQGTEEVRNISSFLESNLYQLGFKREKNFSSHLTIGRVKGGEHRGHLVSIIRNLKSKDLSFGVIHVKEILLKKSQLTPKGPIYTVLRRKVLD